MVKILVAEDDKDLNRLVCACLRASGYDVTSCLDGQEALSRFEEEKFSLVLSDIMMPRLDGFEFF